MIEPLQFEVAGGRLCGAFHVPNDRPRGGVLLCPPLLEERKGAARPYFELGERLAGFGVTTLRFDYRGTGDSEGRQEDMTLASSAEDVRAALAELQGRCGASIVVTGLRLGATLAAMACEKADDLAGLLLWEPVLNGEEFFRLNVRRHMFRRSLIRSHVAPRSQAGGDGSEQCVDLDGFLLRREFCEELRAINLAAIQRPRFPVTLFQVSHNQEPRKHVEGFVGQWGAEFRPFVCEPFWSRIGYVDCSELTDASVEWIVKRFT